LFPEPNSTNYKTVKCFFPAKRLDFIDGFFPVFKDSNDFTFPGYVINLAGQAGQTDDPTPVYTGNHKLHIYKD